jgi:signal transduction histidine kinase
MSGRLDGLRRPWAVLPFAALYVGVGMLGRTTVLDGTALALVWPAAGLALLWFLLRGARLVSLDTLLLAAGAFAVMMLSGAEPGLATVVMTTNVGQTLLAVELLRRWCPDLYGAGGDRAIDSPPRLARFAGVITLAMAAGAVVGVLGTLLTGREADGVDLALWFGRNLCGALVLTTVGLLVAQRLAQPSPRPPLVGAGAGGPAELVLAAAFTVGIHALAVSYGDLPLAFILLAGTVWFGTRFGTLIASVEAALAGVAVVVATLGDDGLFGAVTDPEVSALVAQLYVVTTLLVGLALATGRDENRRLTGEVLDAEAEAVAQARVLDAVIAHIDSGVAVVGKAGEVLFRNDAAARVLGRGQDLTEAGETGRRLAEPVRRALAGEQLRGLELAVGAQGERIFEVAATPLPSDGRRRRGRALLLFRDTTTEHEHRAELLAFAGAVAHDLRNPLAAVEGWTDLIEEHLEQEDLGLDLARQFVARVQSSSARMRELIDGLLAHAQSRDRELKLVVLDLDAVVADVARARGASDEVGWDPLPAVRADPVLVRQLLDNLVGNALKYVAPGVRPVVRVTARQDGPGAVAVAVVDNGIGLPDGEHEKVFGEFHRAHHREYDGSGLGLAICRRIVARHGGTIRAFDNPAGQGTVFEFTLPAV